MAVASSVGSQLNDVEYTRKASSSSGFESDPIVIITVDMSPSSGLNSALPSVTSPSSVVRQAGRGDIVDVGNMVGPVGLDVGDSEGVVVGESEVGDSVGLVVGGSGLRPHNNPLKVEIAGSKISIETGGSPALLATQ